MNARSKRILVVANETVAGQGLMDAVKRHADAGPVHVHVVCPQNAPKHGYVIFDGTVRDAAENRLKMTLAQMKEIGVEATGEVMDPDPYSAVMDALGDEDYDEIIVSTHPETRSGWLRENLIDRLARATRRPVEHVVVDVDADREDDAKRTLVVANQTVDNPALVDALKKKAGEGERRFFLILPQSGAEDGDEQAAERLAAALKRLEEAGIDAMGQVVHPDPYTAIQNAIDDYAADEVVISTFPETRSGWLRNDLVERVRSSTTRPVEHVVSEES